MEGWNFVNDNPGFPGEGQNGSAQVEASFQTAEAAETVMTPGAHESAVSHTPDMQFVPPATETSETAEAPTESGMPIATELANTEARAGSPSPKLARAYDREGALARNLTGLSPYPSLDETQPVVMGLLGKQETVYMAVKVMLGRAVSADELMTHHGPEVKTLYEPDATPAEKWEALVNMAQNKSTERQI